MMEVCPTVLAPHQPPNVFVLQRERERERERGRRKERERERERGGGRERERGGGVAHKLMTSPDFSRTGWQVG